MKNYYHSHPPLDSRCLLRFLVRHKGETLQKFEERMKKAASESEDTKNGEGAVDRLKTDTGWALGSKLCGKGGSLVQDVWEGSAADLLAMDRIAIFPVKGWWAFRKFPVNDRWHQCHALPMRYSLIVSVESEQDIPLYNEISNLLSVPLDAA